VAHTKIFLNLEDLRKLLGGQVIELHGVLPKVLIELEPNAQEHIECIEGVGRIEVYPKEIDESDCKCGVCSDCANMNAN